MREFHAVGEAVIPSSPRRARTVHSGMKASATITSVNVRIWCTRSGERGDQRLDDAEKQTREHHPQGARDSAEDRYGERLRGRRASPFGVDVEERRDKDPGGAGEHSRCRAGRHDGRRHVNPHEPPLCRGVRTMAEQRRPESARKEVQCRRGGGTATGIANCSGRHAEPLKTNRALRASGATAASESRAAPCRR